MLEGGLMSAAEKRERIVLMRDKGRITIPASWRERYGLEEGSEMVLVAEEERLVLYPRREQRLEQLLDEVKGALESRGITLEDLLEESRRDRERAFRETYGGGDNADAS